VDNDGLDGTAKKCYLDYTLYRDYGNNKITVQGPRKLTTAPETIDTMELGATHLQISLRIKANTSTSFEGNNNQVFKPQVEYGSVVTSYTPPMSEENIGVNKVYVYGRNLYINGIPSSIPTGNIIVNSKSVINSNGLGMHYVHSVVNENNTIIFEYGNGQQVEVQSPLLAGDEFTLIYNVSNVIDNELYISSISVVRGHVDYFEYEPMEVVEVLSDVYGHCDISGIKYPYSFISMDDEVNDGYVLYLSYDPALSRKWTEEQLKNLSNKIDVVQKQILMLIESSLSD
jgi:hypothetical protein